MVFESAGAEMSLRRAAAAARGGDPTAPERLEPLSAAQIAFDEARGAAPRLEAVAARPAPASAAAADTPDPAAAAGTGATAPEGAVSVNATVRVDDELSDPAGGESAPCEFGLRFLRQG